jgi:hypothetical protein
MVRMCVEGVAGDERSEGGEGRVVRLVIGGTDSGE